MYKIYNEYEELIRIVKRKEEADYFVDAYGWTKKFFKEEVKQFWYDQRLIYLYAQRVEKVTIVLIWRVFVRIIIVY